MSRWLLFAVSLVVSLVACNGSANTTPALTDASSSSSTSLSPETSTALGSELRSEFVSWVAPIDLDELRVGWEAMVLPDRLVRFPAMADCWEANGFDQFARNVREYAAVMIPDGEDLYPDMGRLKESGFSDVPSFWVDLLLVASRPEALPGSLESSLAHAPPDWGLRLEDQALIREVGAKCYQDGGILTPTMGIPETAAQWVTTVAALDQEPEMAALIDETVVPCLRGISPEFSNENFGTWLGVAFWAPTGPDSEDAEMWAMPEETLVKWGQGFAECMEPLVDARREPRLAAREAWIDEWYDELVEFQAEADEQSAANP